MIHIQIKSTNIELTDHIKEYVDKKISPLSKFLNNESNILCEVELGTITGHHKSGDIFKAEVNLSEPATGKQYFAVKESSDVYSAIDLVRDSVEEIVVSKKKKKDSLWRRGASKLKSLLKRTD